MNEAKIVSNETCCSRELTLREEIEILHIDEITRSRLLDKCKTNDKNRAEAYRHLENCHARMERLEKAVVELSVMLASSINENR